MDLSGIEMIAIFLIALLVLGPDELIKYAVKLGRFIAKMRTQFENFKVMTQEELLKRADGEDMESLKSLKNQVENLGSGLSTQLKGTVDSVAKKPVAPLENLSEAQVEDNLIKLKSNR